MTLLGVVVAATAPQVVMPAFAINALTRECTFVRVSQLRHVDGPAPDGREGNARAGP